MHAVAKQNKKKKKEKQFTQLSVVYKRKPPPSIAKKPLYMSRLRGGVLILIPVYAIVLMIIVWVAECCGYIIHIFFKLIKTLKAEHCLSA